MCGMMHFFEQQVDLTKQDYGNWRAKQARRWRGLNDLFARRLTDERREMIGTLRFLAIRRQ